MDPNSPAPKGQERLAQGLYLFSLIIIPPEGLAPKGQQDLAQGFNPGNPQNKRFALKGRQDTR
jgi:hypothetical protein